MFNRPNHPHVTILLITLLLATQASQLPQRVSLTIEGAPTAMQHAK